MAKKVEFVCNSIFLFHLVANFNTWKLKDFIEAAAPIRRNMGNTLQNDITLEFDFFVFTLI